MTSFWDYIPGSSHAPNAGKKENALPARPIVKRKRDSVDKNTKPVSLATGKRKGASALKDVTPLGRTTPKKPLRVYGAPRASTSKRQLALNNVDSRSQRSQSAEVIGLTISSPDGPDAAALRKRRRVEKAIPGGHGLATESLKHTHTNQPFPTPPPTHLLKKSTTLPDTLQDQRHPAGPLPNTRNICAPPSEACQTITIKQDRYSSRAHLTPDISTKCSHPAASLDIASIPKLSRYSSAGA